MKNILYFLVAFTISLMGCSQTDCATVANSEQKQKPAYHQTKMALQDSILSWKKNSVSPHWINVCDVRPTLLFFTHDQKRVFFVLHLMSKDQKAKTDDVQYGVGEVDNLGNWTFYVYGLPTIIVTRKSEKYDSTYTEMISNNELINGGLFEDSFCKVNDEYINGWFSEDLQRGHESFLQKIKTDM